MKIEDYRSQTGEDWLLDEFFGHKPAGYYVEVGAYDGFNLSNTYFFERRGWTGVLVEPIAALADQCKHARPRSLVVNCAAVAPGTPDTISLSLTPDAPDHSSIALDTTHLAQLESLTGRQRIDTMPVRARTLDQILEEASASTIDFITIDVEGHEWDVLQGFDVRRWRPRVIILERNYRWPDRRIIRWLHARDYCYLRTTGVNDWFVLGQPGETRSARYLAWLGLTLYGRLAQSEVTRIGRRALRVGLRSMGLLETARAVTRYLRHGEKTGGRES